MDDNVFEKLDRIEDKVDALSPSTTNETETINYLIEHNDLRLIEFVKTANRVFRYRGDKSELKRKNKINKCNDVLCAIISVISMAIASVFFFLIFGNVIGSISVIIGISLCSPYVIFAFTKKPFEYETPYIKWFSKLKTYEYDDNGIVCEAKDKWYIVLHRILSIVYLYGAGFGIMSGGLSKDFNLIYSIVSFVLIFIGALTMQFLLGKKEYYYYDIYFEDEKNSIEYFALKDFMTKNGLK